MRETAGEQRSPSVLDLATRGLRGGLAHVAAISCAINVLAFTSPLFLHEVFDRVLDTRSPSTLGALTLLAAGLLLA